MSAPEGGTFSATTTAFAHVAPEGVTSIATASESPSSPTDSSGFVPPGGTLRPGPANPNADLNTVAAFTLPNTGDGAEISLASSEPPPNFCGKAACRGQVVDLSAFDGYNDPQQPALLLLRYDASIVVNGTSVKLYAQSRRADHAHPRVRAASGLGPHPAHDQQADERRGLRTAQWLRGSGSVHQQEDDRNQR